MCHSLYLYHYSIQSRCYFPKQLGIKFFSSSSSLMSLLPHSWYPVPISSLVCTPFPPTPCRLPIITLVSSLSSQYWFHKNKQIHMYCLISFFLTQKTIYYRYSCALLSSFNILPQKHSISVDRPFSFLFFFFLAVPLLHWMDRPHFNHFAMYGHLDCFQYVAITLHYIALVSILCVCVFIVGGVS